MAQNKLNLSKGFVFLVIGTLPFLNLAFGQNAPANGGFVNGNTQYYSADAGAAKAAPVTVYPKVGAYALLTWGTLSHFPRGAPSLDDEIDPTLWMRKKKPPVPGFIKTLNHSLIAVAGFMLPLDTDEKGEKATSFILARSQSTCCYGITPKMNEWIYVQMRQDTTAEILMDSPITVFGTIEIGEKNDRNSGWSLYRMTGDKVELPKNSLW
jgi:hypothetical protein